MSFQHIYKKSPDMAKQENTLKNVGNIPQGNYPLPNDSRSYISDTINQNKCHNLGLLLQKYIGPYNDKWQLKLKGEEKEGKKEFFSKVISSFNNYNEAKILLNEYFNRWKAILDSFQGQKGNWWVKKFPASPRWRLVAGLGSASVLETAMTLHPVYGFPIIPGSSLKGLAMAYIKGLDTQDFIKIKKEVFGDPKQSGKVIFFDAIPESFPKLELDIMNVHYKEYYEHDKPPADWLTPTPIYFLTVGKNTSFLFAVASPLQHLAEKAAEWLQGGLKELGVGAKTLVGYGHFDIT